MSAIGDELAHLGFELQSAVAQIRERGQQRVGAAFGPRAPQRLGGAFAFADDRVCGQVAVLGDLGSKPTFP